ncbi:hypothetical protein L2E82_49673 [Cichorium intybus]|uniref:Uncharacterized protein n=1 Tax=Cichorium intybus TaxID=13427 RepID=A0ACB8Z1V4_CICIN|nr:hypothetical protein L2E82_49673 [Cichorium intybus]
MSSGESGTCVTRSRIPVIEIVDDTVPPQDDVHSEKMVVTRVGRRIWIMDLRLREQERLLDVGRGLPPVGSSCQGRAPCSSCFVHGWSLGSDAYLSSFDTAVEFSRNVFPPRTRADMAEYSFRDLVGLLSPTGATSLSNQSVMSKGFVKGFCERLVALVSQVHQQSEVMQVISAEKLSLEEKIASSKKEKMELITAVGKEKRENEGEAASRRQVRGDLKVGKMLKEEEDYNVDRIVDGDEALDALASLDYTSLFTLDSLSVAELKRLVQYPKGVGPSHRSLVNFLMRF